MVPERDVLFWIENFKKRRCRIAAEVGAELVNLIEHEDRIARTGSTNVLNDLSRQSADVCPSVAADLRLIAHAAK